MKKKDIVLLSVGILVAVGALLFVIKGDEDAWLCIDGNWVAHGTPRTERPVSACGQVAGGSFEDCVSAGNPIMESYPRQCRDTEGHLFVESLGNIIEKQNLVKLTSPEPNAFIQSPITITGQARGVWFFEASFPVFLVDWDGKIIEQGIAQAKSDWMTEEFVPFEAVLTFEKPSYGERGALILRKDNPSGLPEHDDALEVPIRFK